MLNMIVFAATVGTLTVDAGAFDRANTPVVVDLPAELADQRLELHVDGKKAALLQTLPDGHGVFILPSLAKGQMVRFDVVEPTVAPEAAVGVDVETDGLELRVGGKRAFRYQMTGRAPTADVPANAVRGGYIHPVLTPSGVSVTDDYHPKHRAHHGIWTAWTAAEFAGRKISFWGSSSGRNDFVALDGVWSGVVAAGFSARHASTDLSSTPARPVLDEEWKVVLYRTHETAPPYFLFDLEWTDRAASATPLVLPEYRYGGLGVRGHGAWDGEDNLLVLTSDGDKNRTSAEGARVRWIYMGGKVDGALAGLTVLVHPENFRAPQPVRVHPNEPFVCLAPAKAGGFAIEPGKPYLSRYRFIVADGAPDRDTLDRLYHDYAHPPAAAYNPSTTRRIE
jgi:hypothetical protein